MITSTGVAPLNRNLHIGLRGDDVMERQNMLNALTETENPLGASNLTELEADGEFGSRTLMRVKEFQSRNNLIVDGVIGPQTDTQMDAIWLRFRARQSRSAGNS